LPARRFGAANNRGYTASEQPSISNQDVEAFVANIKSQIKRNRTNEAARLRNKSVKSSLKTAIRHFREAAESGDRDAALVALQSASRRLDKAASKGVIHPNQAANKKSAMAARANSI
jgi:small subunit ribosomal protein S20